jgi:UDP-2,4-diacetamido-2,4,6-trideoxy-beta-L-altropyranose hydrolase
MNFAIRVDASRSIGIGHVMRCLTLAGALRESGVVVSFACREFDGHLCNLIEARGFAVTRMPAFDTGIYEDAEQTRVATTIQGQRADWLIVDHYGIDYRWEDILRPSVGRIMVIDDLADRPHECDLLLDQNLENPRHSRYSELLPRGARKLLGTSYALVRPEFQKKRDEALRRRDGTVMRLLISIGGTDPENETAKVLAGLAVCQKAVVAIDVVLGEHSPYEQEIRKRCEYLPSAKLHIQTSRMAELMTQADLAINGGGSTTWERCVLGLPAIVTIQSEDQAPIAETLDRMGGHRVLGWSKDLVAEDYGRAIDALTGDALKQMSKVSASLCDGRGADRVAAELLNWDCS